MLMRLPLPISIIINFVSLLLEKHKFTKCLSRSNICKPNTYIAEFYEIFRPMNGGQIFNSLHP